MAPCILHRSTVRPSGLACQAGWTGARHAPRGRYTASLSPLRSCSLRYVGIKVPSPCMQGALLGPCYKTGPTPDSTPGGTPTLVDHVSRTSACQAVVPVRAAPAGDRHVSKGTHYWVTCSYPPRYDAGAQCRGAEGLVCAWATGWDGLMLGNRTHRLVPEFHWRRCTGAAGSPGGPVKPYASPSRGSASPTTA